MEELGKTHPFAHLRSEARIQKNVGLILRLSLVCHALLEAVHVYTNAVGADTLAEDRKFASFLFPLCKCMTYCLPRENGILVQTV